MFSKQNNNSAFWYISLLSLHDDDYSIMVNFPISRFMESVNTGDEFFFVFLSLELILKSPAAGESTSIDKFSNLEYSRLNCYLDCRVILNFLGHTSKAFKDLCQIATNTVHNDSLRQLRQKGHLYEDIVR